MGIQNSFSGLKEVKRLGNKPQEGGMGANVESEPRLRLPTLLTRTVEEDQQLPVVISPGAPLCTSRSLQFPPTLPPLIPGGSLLKLDRSLHSPTLVLRPSFLCFPCSFLLMTAEAVLVAGSEFPTFQPTVHSRGWRRRAWTWGTRSTPPSSCVRVPSAFDTVTVFMLT